VRAMRKASGTGAGTSRQSSSRACEAGGDIVDGILGAARGGRADCTSGCEAGDREIDFDSEWPAARNLFVAATIPGSNWLANSVEGRSGISYGMGLTAIRGVGTGIGAGDGIPGASERSDWNRIGDLYVVGSAAVGIGAPI